MTPILQRLFREPLLHFFAAGGLIFLIYSAQQAPQLAAPETIYISADQIERLALQFQGVWAHEPSVEELDKVIADYIREEVYYREALALGLDQNDAVVRQRMSQKIMFLTDIGAQILNASDEELRDFLAANVTRYQQSARRTFEQVFLGQTATATAIAEAHRALQADAGQMIGERSMLPSQLTLSTTRAVDSIFGEGFSAQIAPFILGEWSGPVTSSYGVHLVRVLVYEPAPEPALEDIRATLLRDWQADRAIELRELDYLAREAKYFIEVQGRDINSAGSP